MDIKTRLREERKRLGYNQTDFAAIGGFSRKTQSNYEDGTHEPTASYLAAIAEEGADILYILTGQRGMVESPKKPEEEALLDNYRNSSEDSRRILRETSAALAQHPGRKKKTG
uniref:Helix-turn-helix domain-containing protein n=1 Tax=Candidatus Kentrum sp. LPFa TaxID=2126335 RepID=A0A450WXD1_9GAMM|nr:MAG: Helix-turn-helix domain-containing protein [Candidatus Kentron sp. LPFa]VFK35208.1 MAG: Helix-turn-helix domain-containing protein [Candidatus Kentron sp. LPFa]